MLISTKEAASKLGYTQAHVRRLIREGVLKAKKIAHDYIIDSKELLKVTRRRSPNGTRKNESK